MATSVSVGEVLSAYLPRAAEAEASVGVNLVNDVESRSTGFSQNP